MRTKNFVQQNFFAIAYVWDYDAWSEGAYVRIRERRNFKIYKILKFSIAKEKKFIFFKKFLKKIFIKNNFFKKILKNFWKKF